MMFHRSGRFAGVFRTGIIIAAFTGIASASAGTLDDSFYTFLERLHGDACAGSIIGARLGASAVEAVRGEGKAGKVSATVFRTSCSVDGVQAATGATTGNGRLKVRDEAEYRVVVTERETGRSVEARLTGQAERLARQSLELKKKIAVLPEGSDERQRLEGESRRIVGWFRTAADREVVHLIPQKRQ